MDGQLADRCWRTIYLESIKTENLTTGDRTYETPIPISVHIETYIKMVVTARGEERLSSAKFKTNGTIAIINPQDRIRLTAVDSPPFEVLSTLEVVSALYNGIDHIEAIIG